MTRQPEQIAQQTYKRRSSANNGLPYRQVVEPDTEEFDNAEPQRMPSSAVKYTTRTAQPSIIRSGYRRYVLRDGLPTQQQTRKTTQPPGEEEELRRHRPHWTLIFGIGMAVMFALWVLGNLAVNWWNVTQDDIHFGRPRTYQVDMVVFHNNDSPSSPSHFIAINFRSHIEIIEFPVGDVSKSKIYQVAPLYGGNQDLVVVTLAFKDINGDAKPDMIISVANTHIAYINDGGQFRPLKPGEQVTPY